MNLLYVCYVTNYTVCCAFTEWIEEYGGNGKKNEQPSVTVCTSNTKSQTPSSNVQSMSTTTLNSRSLEGMFRPQRPTLKFQRYVAVRMCSCEPMITLEFLNFNHQIFTTQHGDLRVWSLDGEGALEAFCRMQLQFSTDY